MSIMRNSQKGAALIISLIMLALITLVVVNGMQGSHLQEQMAGNQRKHVEAMLAAESGISVASACLKNTQYPLAPPSGASTTAPPSCGDTNAYRTSIVALDTAGTSSKGTYWIEEVCGTASPAISNIPVCNPALNSNPDGRGARARARIKSVGYSVASTTGLPTPSSTLNSSLILAKYTGTAIYDDCVASPLKYGLMSRGDIVFAGSGTVNSNMYSDEDVSTSTRTINGHIAAFGSISASVAAGYSTYCPACANPPTKSPVPNPSGALPGLTAGMTAIDCSTLSGDLGGAKYLCETPAVGGDAIKNDMYNGTLYFQGSADIDFSGGVSLGVGPAGAKMPIKIIALGDITFNGGSKDSNFTVWTYGTYRHNGGRNIYGSIIAAGGIDWNGASVFQQDDFGNPGTCQVGISFE